jgi:hypothetical protein
MQPVCTVYGKPSLSYLRVDSVADYARAWDGEDVPEKNRESYNWLTQESRFSWQRDWFGGLGSWDESKAVLTDGWPEGATRALELARQISANIPPITSHRRRVVNSDDGNELRIDQALRGEWDVAWQRSARREITRPVLTIGCKIGGLVNCSAEQLFWSGAQAVALVDALENAGYRVELRAISAVANINSNGGRLVADVMVKRADEPSRPDAIASVVAHAGTFRTGMFALRTRGPAQMSPGEVGATIQEPAGIMQECADKGWLQDMPDVILSAAYSRADAVKHITEAIRKLTGAE